MDRSHLASAIIGILLLLSPGCLKKQSWEVTQPPVWPRYRVAGQVRDRNTEQPLSDIEVTLLPRRVLFPDTLGILVDTTDYTGTFSFDEIPAAVIYLILWDPLMEYQPESVIIVVQHDRWITLYMEYMDTANSPYAKITPPRVVNPRNLR